MSNNHYDIQAESHYGVCHSAEGHGAKESDLRLVHKVHVSIVVLKACVIRQAYKQQCQLFFFQMVCLSSARNFKS